MIELDSLNYHFASEALQMLKVKQKSQVERYHIFSRKIFIELNGLLEYWSGSCFVDTFLLTFKPGVSDKDKGKLLKLL
jgi:hypothetical protein